jgi:membrane dipeptidase
MATAEEADMAQAHGARPADEGRRRFVLAGAAAAAAGVLPARAQAPAQGGPRRLADMHSHYAQFLPQLFGTDLRQHMRDAGTSLLAWSIADDARWIARGGDGIVQTAVPAPGELWAYFQRKVAEYTGRLRRWELPLALTPADVDAALAGEPRVLLASEAANFLEGDVSRLAQAHAAGLRHTQLVHYIQSPLGDHQTAEPRHGGLTPLGAQVVAECRRLGIVVDLAHGTERLMDGAFDASDAPMVWSHSWVRFAAGQWRQPGHIARALSRDYARKIAARGGVIGLWTVRVRDPAYPVSDARSFADEMLRMAELVGPAHVAFGTDMEGAGPNPILNNYVDLRAVADDLARRGLPEQDLHGIFIGNYARVVRQAMAGAAPR